MDQDERALTDEDVSPTDFDLEELTASSRDLLNEEETETDPVVTTEEPVIPSETEQGPIPYVRFKQILDERDQYKTDAEKWQEAKPWERHLGMLRDEFGQPEKADLALRENAETTAITAYERKLAAKVASGAMEQEDADELLAEFGPSIRAAVHAPDVEAQRAHLEAQAKANTEAQALQTYNTQVDGLITEMKKTLPHLNVRSVKAALQAGWSGEEVAAIARETHDIAATQQKAAVSAAVKANGVRSRMPVTDTGRGATMNLSDTGPDPLTDPTGWAKYRDDVLMKR